MVVLSIVTIAGGTHYTVQYMEDRCSVYYYERQERAIPVPASEEAWRKAEYIEKIIELIPEDYEEQVEKWGTTRVEWLIEFYGQDTLAKFRGRKGVHLRDAIR